MISLRDVSFSYGENIPAVDRVSFALGEGEMVAVVGANGSGKSTLLKLMARVFAPLSGSMAFQDLDLTEWEPRAYARWVGYLPQELDSLSSIRALDIVLSGRAPYLSRFQWETEHDVTIAEQSLSRCDAAYLTRRSLDQMSGGERKRVFLARVLAGEPRLILLDEPFAALDLSHIQELFELFRSLARQEGKTIVFVSHDLNWSAAFADRMLVMHQGRLAHIGQPAEVLTAETMRQFFRFEGEIITDSRGRKWILPRSASL